MEGIPRSGCPVLTHWGRQLWDFSGHFVWEKVRNHENFGPFWEFEVSSNDPPISSIVWRNHGKAMFCKVGLLTWKIAALPLIRVVFWMRHSPDQQELENSYERLVFILWATVALCQRNIAYRYIRCWFDAGSIRRVHLIYIWELTSNYMKTMVSWCFLTVLP